MHLKTNAVRGSVVDLAQKKLLKALWSKIEKNTDVSTGPFARPFARSLVHSQRSLLPLLQTARFARALRCAHSFARSLTSLTPSLVGQ